MYVIEGFVSCGSCLSEYGERRWLDDDGCHVAVEVADDGVDAVQEVRVLAAALGHRQTLKLYQCVEFLQPCTG